MLFRFINMWFFLCCLGIDHLLNWAAGIRGFSILGTFFFGVLTFRSGNSIILGFFFARSERLAESDVPDRLLGVFVDDVAGGSTSITSSDDMSPRQWSRVAVLKIFARDLHCSCYHVLQLLLASV